MNKRTETRKIMVKNVQIGGQNRVSIQSMCNTKTKDVTATVNQILELEKAGCEIIRVACLDIEDAKAIKEIKVAKEILKDCNLYRKSPKLVSCPTCGRTQIDLIPIAKEIESFLQGLEADITVAVMGCVVNGPGEARNADIGIAGGIKEGVLFKKGEVIKKIPQDEIVEVLEKEILNIIN